MWKNAISSLLRTEPSVFARVCVCVCVCVRVCMHDYFCCCCNRASLSCNKYACGLIRQEYTHIFDFGCSTLLLQDFSERHSLQIAWNCFGFQIFYITYKVLRTFSKAQVHIHCYVWRRRRRRRRRRRSFRLSTFANSSVFHSYYMCVCVCASVLNIRSGYVLWDVRTIERRGKKPSKKQQQKINK